MNYSNHFLHCFVSVEKFRLGGSIKKTDAIDTAF
jgi:hypothetical protein